MVFDPEAGEDLFRGIGVEYLDFLHQQSQMFTLLKKAKRALTNSPSSTPNPAQRMYAATLRRRAADDQNSFEAAKAPPAASVAPNAPLPSQVTTPDPPAPPSPVPRPSPLPRDESPSAPACPSSPCPSPVPSYPAFDPGAARHDPGRLFTATPPVSSPGVPAGATTTPHAQPGPPTSFGPCPPAPPPPPPSHPPPYSTSARHVPGAPSFGSPPITPAYPASSAPTPPSSDPWFNTPSPSSPWDGVPFLFPDPSASAAQPRHPGPVPHAAPYTGDPWDYAGPVWPSQPAASPPTAQTWNFQSPPAPPQFVPCAPEPPPPPRPCSSSRTTGEDSCRTPG